MRPAVQAMDWISVFALGREGERMFKGCPLEAAYSLGEREYFLSFRRVKRGVLIVLDPSNPRLWMCEKPRDASAPSPAAMLVRKHLERGKLKRVKVPAGERILLFDFDPGVLAVELIPGKANMAVVWDGFLMGSHAPLRRGGSVIHPGERYALPPREGARDLFAVAREAFEEGVAQGGVKSLFPYLPAWFCEEWVARGGDWEAFASLLADLRDETERGFFYAPAAGARKPGDAVASPFPLRSRAKETETRWERFSDAVAAQVATLRNEGFGDSPAARAVKRLRAEEKRLVRTLDKLRAERAGAAEAWRERRKGELLLLALSAPDVRDGVVHTTDPYEDPPVPVAIAVDPAKSLQDNAAQCFKRAKRLERALPIVEARLREIEAALEGVRARIARVEADPSSVSEDDATPPTASPPIVPTARRKPSLRGLRVFRSSDGFTIYAGKDAAANDRLTLRVARPHDVWLHASGFGGSHVVVVNPAKNATVPERTLREAAEIAAYMSRGRLNARLDVVVAERRHVRKRKGAPAGQVTLSKFATMRVEPRIGVEEIARAEAVQATRKSQ